MSISNQDAGERIKLELMDEEREKKKKKHYSWWGHVRAIVQAYPEQKDAELYGVALRNRKGVEDAISATERMIDGADRLNVIRLLHWDRLYTLDGVGVAAHCGRTTAANWQREFFEMVARNRDMLD